MVRQFLTGNGWHPATRRSYLIDLRAFFSYGVNQRLIAQSPAEAIEFPMIEDKPPERESNEPESSKQIVGIATKVVYAEMLKQWSLQRHKLSCYCSQAQSSSCHKPSNRQSNAEQNQLTLTMKKINKLLALAATIGVWSSTVTAHHISGTIVCTDTEIVTPLAGIDVTITAQSGTVYTVATDANGDYYQTLPTATETYDVTIEVPTGYTITWPESGAYSLDIYANGVGGPHSYENVDFDLTGCVPPPESLCWMTAGGVKFEPLANEELAEANDGKGPNDSFGGNVYPSCSKFPGDGGHWNHVSHRLKLHLNGQIQNVIKCGNVEGHEPGTDSPECDVNFIHWEGWGTISPINGGKTEHKVPVYYEAKVEDRAEPGNLKSAKNQPDEVDRYWIKVYYLNDDMTRGEPVEGFEFGTYDDPIQITGGNLQIHCSSCD